MESERELKSRENELGPAGMLLDSFAALRWHTRREKCRFLFVFDEFDSILYTDGNVREPYRFYNWRRAILHMKCECFNIVLSTTAKLTNFSPPVCKDPSARVIQGQSLCTHFSAANG